MDVDFAPHEAEFREEVRTWLDEHIVGEFAAHRGVGSPTDDSAWDVRIAWEKELSADGWLGLTWPQKYGGRGASLTQEIIFEYEYARAAAPARVNSQALELLGPTLLAFGTEAQKTRFLPRILGVEDMWGQGFSEPSAGSDIASLSTRARLDGDQWVIDGQKVWTTFGHRANWLYVVCRTNPDSSVRHKGLTMLLVPVDQPGVEVRPIQNVARSGEFSECFFTGARTDSDLVVGEVNGGWNVVMATLGLERGAALLPMQLAMEREVFDVIDEARHAEVSQNPLIRQRIAGAYMSVQLMRATTLRVVSSLVRGGHEADAAAAISKLFASTEHQKLGELAMDVQGSRAHIMSAVGPEGLSAAQRIFLLSRAESIYGGTSEIQRNIIAERVLGLPK
ncbi:acyl-CoA dehydrogenase family protein [Rhodococcus rhodochrous]|uniref:Acyl-CoA dehydrogenase n=1 Tax=Rhodococcus rhodochrous KG-21 TaxID=1441923 RepID=A0A0M9WPH5_RHORH|nr:acyl-CoA dehydrogenase family protein [Rhodococcus rhodochrous]KOS56710.1 acyl-CoA dehydrogenase [Rhodococcus rhodochrous KG-21]